MKFTPDPLVLDGNPLPWIEHANYLGNVITSIPDGWSKDARQKRAQYIEKNVEIIQEFPSAHPEVKCKINRIYNSSFPGAMLYDLSSDSVTHLVNSWSVSVRRMWGLPLQAHRYIITQLGGDTCTRNDYLQICKISAKYSEIRKTTSEIYATKGIQKCEHDNREKCKIYRRQAGAELW